jgi:hypothetical protein
MSNGNTLRIAVVVCCGLPLLFLHVAWANAALIGYSLTAVLFGILLIGEYPPFGTGWFWKTMVPIIIMHLAVVFGLVLVTLGFPEINKLPRVVYGLLAVVLVVEWRLALRIIETFEPKSE